jgi:hypothetical protein
MEIWNVSLHSYFMSKLMAIWSVGQFNCLNCFHIIIQIQYFSSCPIKLIEPLYIVLPSPRNILEVEPSKNRGGFNMILRLEEKRGGKKCLTIPGSHREPQTRRY